MVDLALLREQLQRLVDLDPEEARRMVRRLDWTIKRAEARAVVGKDSLRVVAGPPRPGEVEVTIIMGSRPSAWSTDAPSRGPFPPPAGWDHEETRTDQDPPEVAL